MVRLGDALVASHLTLVGARRGEPPATRFAERVAAAGAAGFAGIGWRLDDHRRERALGLHEGDVRAVLAHAGVALVELEVLYDWWRPDERAARSLRDEAELRAMAGAYGARHLTVCDVEEPDGTFAVDLAAERFAGICDRAADVGLLVALEYLPWSAVPDPATALAVVEAAGRRNGGLQVDAWHTFRGAGLGALRDVPAARVAAVQLDDADRRRIGPWLEDTTRRRRLPGEGSFDLTGFLRTLDAAGVACPIGVEVLSDDLNALPVTAAARRAHDTARRVIDAALAGAEDDRDGGG